MSLTRLTVRSSLCGPSRSTLSLPAPTSGRLRFIKRFIAGGNGVHGLSAPLLRPRGNVTVTNHTMGDSLHRYLEIKMHQALLDRPWDRVIVKGVHSRTAPSLLFAREKRDKPFNWQRPTAQQDGDQLVLQCFPGSDHVRHYAEILSTYSNISPAAKTSSSRVFYEDVSATDTLYALEQTNLTSIPPADILVLGLIHRLDALTGVANWGSGFKGNDDYCGWVVKRIGTHNVAFVGVRPIFWGDICGELVRMLVGRLGIRQVIYVGKLGSTQVGVPPNRYLASGSVSLVRGRRIAWRNVLEDTLRRQTTVPVLTGAHVTVPSVLFETKDWLADLPEEYHFVDPEVGMMARAASEAGVSFGYLHIVSDNVREKYAEDLSNERLGSVVQGRDRLYAEIQRILGQHLRDTTL